MKTRIISSLVFFPILALMVIIGGNTLVIGLMLLSLIGLYEFYNAFSSYKPVRNVGYIFTVLFYLVNFIFKFKDISYNFILLVMILIVISLTIMVIYYPKYNIIDIMITCFGFLYVSVLFSYIIEVRNLQYGNWLVWLVFICAWGNDTFAYFTGVFLGKTKLVPKLSPKKTVEGAIGGIIGSALLAVLYSLIVKMNVPLFLSSKGYLIIACSVALSSTLAIIGDLAASAVKRFTNVKDFGNIIPGHGGILDRFDSVLFTAPAIYTLINFLLK